MKILIRITIALILAVMALPGDAQIVLCAGNSTTLTAINAYTLSNPTYSLQPGGIISPNPSFTVAPVSDVTYTLYTTGTNTNSVLVTTTNTIGVQMSGATFALFSPDSYTLGCASKSICNVSIMNGLGVPVPGVSLGYLLLPGLNPALPPGTLSSATSGTISVPGIWSAFVKNNITGCVSSSTFVVTLNNAPPVIYGLSTTQLTLSCANPTATVQATPNSALSYSWWPAGVTGNSITVVANTATPTQSLLTLNLTATDNNNACQSNTTVAVYQNFYAPNALVITSSSPVCEHSVIYINMSSSGIPASTGFSTILPISSILWEGPYPQPSLAFSSNYTAQVSGDHTVTVMDSNNGCTTKGTFTVALGPTAAFVHTVTGAQVIFNNTSIDPDLNSTYYWNFGDGYTSIQQNPTHTYMFGGAYLVTLKLTNNISFCKDSVVQSLYISGPACSANSGFSMAPTPTAQVWNVTPDYPWNVTAARWSWGDGYFSNALYTSHQYSSAGQYNICLSVTVSCGDTSTTCIPYSVNKGSEAALMFQVNVVAPGLILLGLNSSDADEQLVWDIAPNPNEGEFKLNLNTIRSEEWRIVISDLSGRMVHNQLSEPGSGSLSINADLPPGMYFVTLQSGNMKSTKRMVVIH